MKRILLIGVLFISVILCSGCFKRDNYEGITIYTTSYPITYLTDQLYGYNAKVESIYPQGANYNTYKLSNKQVAEYSKAPILVYNGLSQEKDIAKNFVNQEKDLKIIDVSYGLVLDYGLEELWLSPNNYLMLATTLKNNLQELITNKYIDEEIDANFKVLEEKISVLDAELRLVGKAAQASNSNKIYVAYDALQFLNDYGFEVISIQNEANITTEIENEFKAGTAKYILVTKDQIVNPQINESVTKAKAQLIIVDSMLILTDEQANQKSDYFTIMNIFLENIKKVTLKIES